MPYSSHRGNHHRLRRCFTIAIAQFVFVDVVVLSSLLLPSIQAYHNHAKPGLLLLRNCGGPRGPRFGSEITCKSGRQFQRGCFGLYSKIRPQDEEGSEHGDFDGVPSGQEIDNEASSNDPPTRENIGRTNSKNEKPRYEGKKTKTKAEGKSTSGGLFGNYQFGDITRSIGRQITKDPNYEIGDISQSIIRDVTKNDEYEFGDLSRWVDGQIKSKATNFTGKDSYQIGDITKEIGRKVSSGEYTLADIALLCKALLSLGVGFSPVASFLPVSLLVKLLNFSIAEEVSGRLAGAVALELDKRMKESITGDAEYKLGDVTKRAVTKFVGKDGTEEGYRLGDITRTVRAHFDGKSGSKTVEDSGASEGVLLFGQTAGTTGDAGKGGGGTDEQGLKHQQSGGISSSDANIDPKLLAELDLWEKSRSAGGQK